MTRHCHCERIERTMKIISLALCVLWATFASAQTVNDAAGISMPLDNALGSARSAALGSAFVAVADDGSALFWNPAGLGSLPAGELSLHHEIWLADTSQDTLLAALPVGDLGGIGLAAHYFNYGSFEGRDSNGAPTPGFSANQTAFQAGWGRNIGGHFSVGLGLLAAQQNLGGRTYAAFFANGGLLYEPLSRLSLGIAFTGLGENGVQGQLPFALNLGAALRPQLSKDWGLLLAGAGSLEQGGVNLIQLGAEGVFEGQYSVRAGYQLDLVDNQLEGVNGLTLGAGYRWQGLSLDYAFLPMGDLGASQRVSLSYYFTTATTPHSMAKGPLEKSASNEPSSSPNPASSPVSTSALSPETKPFPSMSGDLSPSPPGSPSGGSDDLEIQFQLSPDTVNQGKELEKEGKYQEAVALYIQTIHNDQKNLLAWWGLGNIYYRLGRKEYAIQCFQQILQIKPDATGLAEWLEKYRAAPVTTPTTQP
jgi:tetratricopeptide (TPR) repeat protein